MISQREMQVEEQYKEFVKMCIARARKTNEGSDWQDLDIRKDAQEFLKENQDMYKRVLKNILIELDEMESKPESDGICSCASILLHGKYASIKEYLDTSGEYIEPFGISAYVISSTLAQINSLADKWPAYSGDNLFPVPLYLYRPREAYKNAKELGIMWEGEYGSNRKAFLKFLINQLS